MKAGTLIINPDADDRQMVDIEHGVSIKIGRKPANAGEQKVVITDPEVSSQHAEIQHTNHGWILRDSGSTNGTSLNGERLAPGREYIMRDGDRIKIAQTEIKVVLDQDTPNLDDGDIPETTHLRIAIFHATILVADLRGFTGIMEEFADEPETVMQAAQTIFQYFREEIHNNHGRVEKVVGDALMADWSGAFEESKDNAYKACQTALQLRSLARSIARNPAYWPFPKHPLHLDLALTTGPVAAGALLYDENNPALWGDTANVAFRIEALIPEDSPGEIVVDGTTFNLTNQYFQYTPLGDFAIRGRQKQVSVYKMIDYIRNQ